VRAFLALDAEVALTGVVEVVVESVAGDAESGV
jgi:hypothetical protein